MNAQLNLGPEFLDGIGRVVQQAVKTALAEQAKSELAEKYLTPEQVCNIIPISKVTLAKYCKSGLFKKFKHAGKVTYKYSEVVAAWESGLIKKYKRTA